MLNKFFKKGKSQAALEFLTTYAWAFIVILGVVGAMIYFGFLEPSSFIEQRCDAPSGFLCDYFVIEENSASFLLVSILGRDIEIISADFMTAEDSYSCQVVGGIIRNRDRFDVTCNSIGDSTGDLVLIYNHARGASLDVARTAIFYIGGVVDASSITGGTYQFSGGVCEYPEEVGITGLEPCIEPSPLHTNVFSVSSWEETSNPGPRKITIGPVDIPGVRYECRTAHVSNIGSADWVNCDGASGTNPVHYIQQDGNHLRGNYQTQIRFRAGEEYSDVKTYSYYMWSYEGFSDNLFNQGLSQSLSHVCTNAENHTAFFEAALQHISAPGPFHSNTNLDGPEMTIRWDGNLWTQQSQFASFKKELHFNENEHLILLKRRYGSVHNNRCTLPFKNQGMRFGVLNTGRFNRDSRAHYWCDAIVVNRNGNAVCLVNQGGQISRVGPVINNIRNNIRMEPFLYANHGMSHIHYFSFKQNENTAHSYFRNQFDQYGNPINPENHGYPLRYLIIN